MRDVGGEVVIVSSDKDLMQLVGDRVSMLDTMKNVRIGLPEVFEKFGVTPDKVVDVQALCGDSVDNVPGAPGIGIKTASALINEYGDLDTLLARACEIKQDKRRQTLIDFADQIRLSRELVQLDCDTPLPQPIDELAVAEPDAEVLGDFLERMEFRTLARRVTEARNGGAPAPAPKRPEAEAPKPIDTSLYACVRDLATLDAWIARAREAGVVAFDTETDGPSSATSDLCGVSLAVAPGEACYIPLGHSAAEGLALETLADLDQIPLAAALARAEAAARGPGRPQGRPQRQVRHGGVFPARRRRRADRGHHADLLRAGGRRCTTTAWTSWRSCGWATSRSASRRWPGPARRRRASATSRCRRPPATPPRTPTSPCASTGCCARGWPARACSPSTRRWSGRCRRCWRRWSWPGSGSIRTSCAGSPTTSRMRMADFEAEATRLVGRPFNLGSPKQIGDVLFGEMGLPGGKKTATGVWSTDASVLEELAAEGQPCRGCCSTGASSPS